MLKRILGISIILLILISGVKEGVSDSNVSIFGEMCQFFDSAGNIIKETGIVRTNYFKDQMIVTCASHIENTEKLGFEYSSHSNPTKETVHCNYKSMTTPDWNQYINPNGNMILQCIFNSQN